MAEKQGLAEVQESSRGTGSTEEQQRCREYQGLAEIPEVPEISSVIGSSYQGAEDIGSTWEQG